jgi:predicted transposase/invertase (TIGR01784 family)
MNFDVDFGKGCDEVVQYMSLRNDQHPWVRYNMVHLAFVRLLRFEKTEAECRTAMDKLIYTIKNAQDLEERPKSFKGEMFDDIFDLANISKFTPEERMTYEQRLKYRGIYEANQEFAMRKGLAQGLAEGRAEGSLQQAQKMAKWMLAKGMSLADIEEATSLTPPEILSLSP